MSIYIYIYISIYISEILIFIIILSGAAGHFFKSLNETCLSYFLVFYLVPHAAALRSHLLDCSSGTPFQFYKETIISEILIFIIILLGEAAGHFFKSLNETRLSLFLVFYLLPHAALRSHLLECSSGTLLQFYNETFLIFFFSILLYNLFPL